MSQENIEVLRKAYELAESRGVEGLLDFATEDLVWISDPRFPGGGTHLGKENVRRWLRKLWIYDEISIDIEQIIDLDDRALGITRFSGLSHDGPRVDWLWCHLVSAGAAMVAEDPLWAVRGPRHRLGCGLGVSFVARGIDEVVAYWREWAGSWETYVYRVAEISRSR